MLVAYRLAVQCLPTYWCKYSRHDFTLAQLFACLVVKEQMRRSYRGAEELLRDSADWCRAIGLKKVPDHNTLCRAARLLLTRGRVNRILDLVVRWAVTARILGMSQKPLAIDSTGCDSHHVSRHYERRCTKSRRGNSRRSRPKSSHSDTARRLPRFAIAVSCACHLPLSIWTGTGAGSDRRHFERLVIDAWRRLPHRRLKLVADAGYDAEDSHRVARQDMGIQSIIPAAIGRPTQRPPTQRWRRYMAWLLKTKERRRRSGYTQRWQVETVMSMIKRNLGDELSGKSAHSRKRDMMLKVLTHCAMILRRKRGLRQSRSQAICWVI